MGSTQPRRFRTLAIVTSALVASSLLISVPPALADTAPMPTVESTVSSDALPTVQIDGVVWDQVIVGNTVYVGGSFGTARPAGSAPGVNTVPRTHLLAYNLTTGALITSFNHILNGQVFSVAASPDGSKLYIGGQFTQVNGVTRNRIAAFNIATGALMTTFAPSANTTVYAVAATNTTVYAGGNFTTIAGSTRIRAAAMNAANGALLPFAPVAQGGNVRAIVISPDQSKVVLGGNFTTLNGSGNPGYGLGAVNALTGASMPWNANGIIRNGGTEAAIYSLDSDSDSVYGSGYHFGGGGTLEGVFRADWANGDIVWVEDCHGDTYSVSASTDVVYTASHAHYCGNSGGFPQTSPTWTIQRAMAWSKSLSGGVNTPDPYGYYSFTGVPTPKLLNWWPDINTGTFTGANQGAWDVTANDDYVLYAGEFTRVNNGAQQGIVRFAKPSIAPNKDGPRLSGAGFVPSVASLATGTARITWLANYDRDNQYLKYDVIRNGANSAPIYTTTAGSRIWFDRPTMGYIDRGLTPGQIYSYRLRATDPFGNVAYGNPVNVTISASGELSEYASAVITDGAASYWRLGEDNGPTVFDWSGFNDAQSGAGVTSGGVGAIAGDANKASTFSGTDAGLVSTRSPIQGPDSFAIEAWFKTTSTTGGKIVGFGNSNTGTSSSYDRHVYMDASGRVLFGVYPGEMRTVQSASGFNDGQWHHVVANLGPTGMQLYVDGIRVGQRTDTTFGQPYSGYWRIGGDSSWSGNNFFAGTIDDVAIYNQPMSLQKVNQHLVLSGRPSAIPAAPADAYGAAVMGDSPDIYWRLDETGGTSAGDVSGGGDTGLYTGGVTKNIAGAISGTSNSAASFDGIDGLVSSTLQYSNPQTYSLEAWFQTTSGSGGKIIGFGRNQTGSSSSYDRHVYLQDDGRLVYGTYTGQTNTVTTSAPYNDGRWHHVVATQSSAGLRLYVDGNLQGTNPATGAEGYDGYWRVGGDTTWGSTSSYLDGKIDEVAVYGTALPASAVTNHFTIGAGVVANTPPSASFSSSITDLTLSVDGSASIDRDGSVVGYAWDFGDGTTSSGAVTTHTFPRAGTYSVALTVTDDNGATNRLVRSVSAVAPNVAPEARFITSANSLTVSADAAGSTDSDGTITSYAWAFGDGATATGVTASHPYATSGTYTITLTVTDDDGATNVTTNAITVTAAAPVNVPPTARFTSTSAGLVASFDSSTSSDSDGSIVSSSWAFGDGTSATGASTTRTYASSGTFTVVLTVTDNNGAIASVSQPITVTAVTPPTTALAIDDFARTIASGLGSAPTGGAWTTSGSASAFSVNGSAAVLRSTVAGSNLLGYLTAVRSTDAEVRTVFALQQATSGSGTFVSLIGRRVGTADYRARVALYTSGQVVVQAQRNGTTLQAVVVPGLTYAVGDKLNARVQTFGTSPTTLRAKVWKVGSAEPAAWQVSTTDSTVGLQTEGHIGIGTYVSTSSSVLPLSVVFDELWAGSTTTAPPGPVTPPANIAPSASFGTTSTGLSVATDAASSTDSDGSIVAWAWAYGDGSVGTGAVSTHPYATAGTYTITLTVTDNGGATSTTTRSVTVSALTPPPGPVGVLASDSFERNVAAGWASSEVGGAWSGAGASFAVSGGAGRITSSKAGALNEAFLTSVSSAATDVRVTIALEQASSGTGTFISVIGRRVTTQDYRARVVIYADGKVNLQLQRSGTTLSAATVAGLSYATGDNLNVRLQVVGTSPTTLRVKAWKAGTPEPTTWNLETTDATAALQAPGGVGLGTYTSTTATVIPLGVRFDDFSAVTLG